MELKKGVFGIYRGTEYSASVDVFTNEVLLYSRDPKDMSKGFVLLDDGLYRRRLPPHNVKYLYERKIYAVYKGLRCSVPYMGEGKVELMCGWGDDYREAERLGFDQVERFLYYKVVPEEEIDEFKVETVAWEGFSLPPELEQTGQE
jgi:hypothetical protein